MRVCGMRTGISLAVTAEDRRRLGAILADRYTPQKHVWRARIVLLTAAGAGTNAIMREAGVSKTVVWRCRSASCTRAWTGYCATRPARPDARPWRRSGSPRWSV